MKGFVKIRKVASDAFVPMVLQVGNLADTNLFFDNLKDLKALSSLNISLAVL